MASSRSGDRGVETSCIAAPEPYKLREKAGGEPVIIMLFMGAVPEEVVISGRNLMQLFDYLGDHRIRWVRQMPKGRDFAEAGEPVVTGIEFRQPVVRL